MSKQNLILIVAIGMILVIVAVCFVLNKHESEVGVPSRLDNDVILERNVTINVADECQVNGGIWLAEFNECETGYREWCEENGGSFEECGSACRHMPEAEFCTMQCVLFCKFN